MLEKEREIYRGQMADQKKPAQVIDKIVEGKLEKFFSEQCLLEQPFIKDATGKTQGQGPRGPGERRHQGEDRREALRPLPGGRRRLVVAAEAGSRRPAYRRIVLKLSGEAWPGARATGSIRSCSMRIGAEVREVAELGVRDRHRHRRRQHLPRRGGQRGRHGARHRRLHGHAGHRHQRAGPAGRAREGRLPDARAVGDRDAGGGRALHPPAGHPPPREGPRRDLRRRHRQPVLHHRHRGRAAGGGDRRRRRS